VKTNEKMEAENRVILPIYVNGLRSLADGSMSITLNTQELSPENAGKLFALRRTQGYVLFATEPIDNYNELDGLDIKAMREPKTQSERVRNTLYRIWEQQGKGEEFESFYRRETEAIISKLKMRLD
jgi:hypothetical protein